MLLTKVPWVAGRGLQAVTHRTACRSRHRITRIRATQPDASSSGSIRRVDSVNGDVSPMSSVLVTAQDLSASGISAAGFATFAEASARIPFLLRCHVFDVPGAEADALSDCLLSFGALSASTEEFRPAGQHEQEIFADGSGKTWDRCTVTALFPSEHDIQQTLQTVQDVLQVSVDQHQVEQVPDQEWVNAMKDSYQPTKVCDGLWIVPDWCEPPEPDALNIRIAPGLAFGTGEHATTRLSLQWLFKNQDLVKGAHVMDYGAGSGVLAVAALLMGAASAVGTDVDPLAVKAAQDNAALNSVGDRLTAIHCLPSVKDPDPVQTLASNGGNPTFDICIANILRGPLLELQPRLSGYVKPGGHVLLSGILTSQVERVQSAYSGTFDQMKHAEENSWALLTGVRR